MDKNCWQTPEYILKLVAEFFGEDYFDPCPINPDFDGLDISWHSQCFINPPYSRGEIERWSNKAKKEFLDSAKSEFIWLINYGCTSNRKDIKKLSTALCEPNRRISFLHPETGHAVPGNDRDSILYYWGNRPSEFCSVFQKLGITAIRPTTPF